MRPHAGPSNHRRRLTRVVHVGDVALVGDYPIRVHHPRDDRHGRDSHSDGAPGRCRLRNRTRHRSDGRRRRQPARHPARDYTDAEYHAEILRLHDVFSPLVRRAKALGVALFVGRDMVEKDILTGQAAERLVELIRANGKSIDP